jgi:hypothetical protein
MDARLLCFLRIVCDELIIRSEECYQFCVLMYVCVYWCVM